MAKQFQAATGIEPEVAFDDTNEDIMCKFVASGVTDYDRLLARSPFAEALNHLGLASPIERDQFSFLSSLYGPAYGVDNAARVRETGRGLKLDHYEWRDAELAAKVEALLTGNAMQQRPAAKSAHVRPRHGTTKAATIMTARLD